MSEPLKWTMADEAPDGFVGKLCKAETERGVYEIIQRRHLGGNERRLDAWFTDQAAGLLKHLGTAMNAAAARETCQRHAGGGK